MIHNDDEKREFYLAGTPINHPSDAQLLDWTVRIRSGERGSEIDGISRYIIQDFSLRHFLNVPQSPVTIGWLADALGEVLEYSDPLETFGLLPRPKKRPADPQRGWDVACWVAVSERRGYSRAEATQLAAEIFAMDESNVRKMLKTGPEWMNPDEGTWDEYFSLRKRPLPAPRTGKK